MGKSGKHREGCCPTCSKSMRNDNLKRHMCDKNPFKLFKLDTKSVTHKQTPPISSQQLTTGASISACTIKVKAAAKDVII